MALQKLYGDDVVGLVQNAKVLVVGAGGIGCELLKDLVLTGFRDIEVIDLDTIDVSNLNRQFLFRKEHVGRPKSEVARDSVLALRSGIRVVAHVGDVRTKQFGKDFISKFDVVCNALDNFEARRHVNRMCLVADKPLVESGSTGYLGQVSVHRKGISECFECTPKPTQKVYPVCTIRNTPDKPIHCIVWAKYIFGVLFGRSDDSNPLADLASPSSDLLEGGIEGFAAAVYGRLFVGEIERLLSMDDLWKGRRRPTPLPLAALLLQENGHTDGAGPSGSATEGQVHGLKDQRLWSLRENAQAFLGAVVNIRGKRSAEVGSLEFDKDDTDAMDFVTATANLRAHAFGIPLQTRFQAKQMAGNIIPAIASTNAIVAGMQVLQTIAALRNNYDRCKTIYVARRLVGRHLLVANALERPNSKCYVCSQSRPTLRVDVKHFTLRQFVDLVLKREAGMLEPSVSVDHNTWYECGEGLDEDESAQYEANLNKLLSDIGAGDGALVQVQDQQTDIGAEICVQHAELTEDEAPQGFQLLADATTTTTTTTTTSSSSNKVAPASATAAAATTAATTEVGAGAVPASVVGKRKRTEGEQDQGNGDDQDGKATSKGLSEPAAKKAKGKQPEKDEEEDECMVVEVPVPTVKRSTRPKSSSASASASYSASASTSTSTSAAASLSQPDSLVVLDDD